MSIVLLLWWLSLRPPNISLMYGQDLGRLLSDVSGRSGLKKRISDNLCSTDDNPYRAGITPVD
ncbi:hypothetical protein HCEG_02945 [Histoplasma capsulatum var. duboisii H88]|uniref:Uncharacterized protein n=1 Tax=Ajellomyces capsulatus (strain H88) TaxID=544711 RepID=F0UAM1_AJEC8|nr:hypothetical protein HCEG_02945 [Histoplasma capsulatum var. duboisii H88]